jgi:hypothetical protein
MHQDKQRAALPVAYLPLLSGGSTALEALRRGPEIVL